MTPSNSSDSRAAIGQPVRSVAARAVALAMAASSIGLLGIMILLARWESLGHIDILAGPINGWTLGIGLLLASEILGASFLAFNALTLPRWSARVVLPRVGIVCFLVAGATAIAGYAGDVATYTTVTTIAPGDYVPNWAGSQRCHGHVVVAREANPFWHSHGALYIQRGVFLFEDTETAYTAPFGSKPIAEGTYTGGCNEDKITVHFSHDAEEPPVPPVTLRFAE